MSVSVQEKEKFHRLYSNFSGSRSALKDHSIKSTGVGSRTSFA